MKMRDFVNHLNGMSDEWLDKEVFVESPNGLLLPPAIKKNLVTEYPVCYDVANVKNLVITY